MNNTIAAPEKDKRTRKVSKSVKGKKVEPAYPQYDALNELRKNEDLVGTTVTFHFDDGTTKNQPLQKPFIYTDKGRQRSTQDILADLNDIVWDEGASHFSL